MGEVEVGEAGEGHEGVRQGFNVVETEVEILQVHQIADVHMDFLHLVVLQLERGQLVQGFDALGDLLDGVALQA